MRLIARSLLVALFFIWCGPVALVLAQDEPPKEEAAEEPKPKKKKPAKSKKKKQSKEEYYEKSKYKAFKVEDEPRTYKFNADGKPILPASKKKAKKKKQSAPPEEDIDGVVPAEEEKECGGEDPCSEPDAQKSE